MSVTLKTSHAEYVFDVEDESPLAGTHFLEKVQMLVHTLKVVLEDGEVADIYCYGAVLSKTGRALKKQAMCAFSSDDMPEWVAAAVKQVSHA